MIIIIVYIFIVLLIILLLVRYKSSKTININNNYLEELGIGEKQLIAGDVKLLEILYNIRSINPYITNFYNKLYSTYEIINKIKSNQIILLIDSFGLLFM